MKILHRIIALLNRPRRRTRRITQPRQFSEQLKFGL
jgi:hypothetical protein